MAPTCSCTSLVAGGILSATVDFPLINSIGIMTFLHLYLRVLELLGREARLGWALAIADLALAFAIFVEPILFGRIVDTLANSQGHVSDLPWPLLLTLVGAWTGFGLFLIVVGALVALHADRLPHRPPQVGMTEYFGHGLPPPLSHPAAFPSGRFMKVRLTGTTALSC